MRAAHVVLDTGGEVNPEAIGSKLEEIGDNLEQFQEVKKTCTLVAIDRGTHRVRLPQ